MRRSLPRAAFATVVRARPSPPLLQPHRLTAGKAARQESRVARRFGLTVRNPCRRRLFTACKISRRCLRSASGQLTISSIVLAHPLQNPVASSNSQMPTHGEAIIAFVVMPSLPAGQSVLAAGERAASLPKYGKRACIAIRASPSSLIEGACGTACCTAALSIAQDAGPLMIMAEVNMAQARHGLPGGTRCLCRSPSRGAAAA